MFFSWPFSLGKQTLSAMWLCVDHGCFEITGLGPDGLDLSYFGFTWTVVAPGAASLWAHLLPNCGSCTVSLTARIFGFPEHAFQ